MTTAEVIVLVAVVVIVLLAGGGMLVNARLRRRHEAAFDTTLEKVDRDLAAAHAQDKGWDPEKLRGAARRAFAEQRAGDEIREQALVAVIDLPGTDEDKAMFRFVTDSGTFELTLGRAGERWTPVGLDQT